MCVARPSSHNDLPPPQGGLGNDDATRLARSLNLTAQQFDGQGVHDTYDAPGAPVHMVIGCGGADLSLNVEPRPADMWKVSGHMTVCM